MAELSRLEKAKSELSNKDIQSNIENDTLYVFVNNIQLELADFEIDFQVTLFDEKN